MLAQFVLSLQMKQFFNEAVFLLLNLLAGVSDIVWFAVLADSSFLF
jgi:hypothetical protein